MARCESGTILGREISFDASLPLVTGQYKGNRNLDWSDEDSAGHIVPLEGMGQQNPTPGKKPVLQARRALLGRPEGNKIPLPVRDRCLVPQNVEVSVVSADFEKHMFRFVPPVEYLLDHVRMHIESETNRPLISLPPRVAFHPHHHIAIVSALWECGGNDCSFRRRRCDHSPPRRGLRVLHRGAGLGAGLGYPDVAYLCFN